MLARHGKLHHGGREKNSVLGHDCIIAKKHWGLRDSAPGNSLSFLQVACLLFLLRPSSCRKKEQLQHT